MRLPALVLALAAVACHGAGGATPVAPAARPAPVTHTAAPVTIAPPPAAPTPEALRATYEQVSVLGTWDEVLAKFVARVGPATQIGGASRMGDDGGGPLYRWTVVRDDTCYALALQADAGGLKQAHFGAWKRGELMFDECAPPVPPAR